MTSTRSDREAAPSRAAALCLIAAPLTWLVGQLVSPGQANDAPAELALAGSHPDRWAASMALVAIGSMLLIAALPALHRLTRSRLSLVAAVLLGYANIVAASDAINEIGVRSMAVPSADHAQMIALMDRVEAGASAPFFVTGGLSFMLGALLLSVALWRSRAVPAWSAALIGASFVVNLVGWAGASSALVAGSAGAMLIALAPAAGALGLEPTPGRRRPVPATA
jgi:hypothetical protein